MYKLLIYDKEKTSATKKSKALPNSPPLLPGTMRGVWHGDRGGCVGEARLAASLEFQAPLILDQGGNNKFCVMSRISV